MCASRGESCDAPVKRDGCNTSMCSHAASTRCAAKSSSASTNAANSHHGESSKIQRVEFSDVETPSAWRMAPSADLRSRRSSDAIPNASILISALLVSTFCTSSRLFPGVPSTKARAASRPRVSKKNCVLSGSLSVFSRIVPTRAKVASANRDVASAYACVPRHAAAFAAAGTIHASSCRLCDGLRRFASSSATATSATTQSFRALFFVSCASESVKASSFKTDSLSV